MTSKKMLSLASWCWLVIGVLFLVVIALFIFEKVFPAVKETLEAWSVPAFIVFVVFFFGALAAFMILFELGRKRALLEAVEDTGLGQVIGKGNFSTEGYGEGPDPHFPWVATRKDGKIFLVLGRLVDSAFEDALNINFISSTLNGKYLVLELVVVGEIANLIQEMKPELKEIGFYF